jgi:hypothetical protein
MLLGDRDQLEKCGVFFTFFTRFYVFLGSLSMDPEQFLLDFSLSLILPGSTTAFNISGLPSEVPAEPCSIFFHVFRACLSVPLVWTLLLEAL